MCDSYFVQYKKEHAVRASVLLAQGKKKCLSGLARKKVGLRKVVYPAWIVERLFIRSSSEKSWSEKSCLFGLGRREVVYPA